MLGPSGSCRPAAAHTLQAARHQVTLALTSHNTGNSHWANPNHSRHSTTSRCMQESGSTVVQHQKTDVTSLGTQQLGQPAMVVSTHEAGPNTPQQAQSTSKWARIRQNMNMAGIMLFLRILGGDKRLAVPHMCIHDISTVNWEALHQAGFRGVVFDKDNTLTRPFLMQVEPRLLDSLERCKAAFGASGMALYSNSAGLAQYDPHGEEAAALETALGITVVRHTDKKPAGEAGEVAAHFGCAPDQLVMVGDRYLTDVVFGNRHGMLTIRPTPLTLEGEPTGVRLARAVEERFVGSWMASSVQAPAHPLVPDNDCSAFLLNTKQN